MATEEYGIFQLLQKALKFGEMQDQMRMLETSGTWAIVSGVSYRFQETLADLLCKRRALSNGILQVGKESWTESCLLPGHAGVFPEYDSAEYERIPPPFPEKPCVSNVPLQVICLQIHLFLCECSCWNLCEFLQEHNDCLQTCNRHHRKFLRIEHHGLPIFAERFVCFPFIADSAPVNHRYSNFADTDRHQIPPRVVGAEVEEAFGVPVGSVGVAGEEVAFQQRWAFS